MQSDLVPYFCVICGVNAFTLLLPLEKHGCRSDGATGINLLDHFFWHNLKRQFLQHVRREVGVQARYGWKCRQCNVLIGYTAIPFDQFQQLLREGKATLSNKPFFYILGGAVCHNMQQARLMRELTVYKDSVDSHLRRQKQYSHSTT